MGDFVNCYDGNEWDPKLCPDAATCTDNCAIDGVDKVDWTGTYGITGDKTGITVKFVTKGPYSTNIGSRVYLLDESEDKYKMFYLKNKEFTFDVDVSQLPCGLNGALYFVEMAEDGGLSDTNEAGAAYGTGYCDAQCPHDMKWIDGEANCEDWVPSDNDVNSGAGHYGACCIEMDIWEAKAWPPPSHPTHAQLVDPSGARERTAEIMTQTSDTKASVTRMDATSTRGGWGIRPFSDPALTLLWIQTNQ